MKSPAFAYARPASLGEVFTLLEAHGDGAKLLARTTTYSWAALGHQIGGASAGINAEDDAADAAIAAFVEELTARPKSSALSALT